MSIQGLGTSHLEQTQLGKKAVDLQGEFAAWVVPLEFAPMNKGIRILHHPQLHERVKPFLTELGLLDNAYQVLEIPGPHSAPVYSSAGSVYLFPIQNIDASRPTVSKCALRPGEVTYIEAGAGVYVSPKLVLLCVIA